MDRYEFNVHLGAFLHIPEQMMRVLGVDQMDEVQTAPTVSNHNAEPPRSVLNGFCAHLCSPLVSLEGKVRARRTGAAAVARLVDYTCQAKPIGQVCLRNNPRS